MGHPIKIEVGKGEALKKEEQLLNKEALAGHTLDRASILPTIPDLLGYCLFLVLAWVTYLFVDRTINFLQVSQEHIATSLQPFVMESDGLVPIDSDSVGIARGSLEDSLGAARRSVDALARDMSRQREKVIEGDIDPPSPFELTR